MGGQAGTDVTSDLLLGIDVGTSSVRACIFRPDGSLVGTGQVPYAVARPNPGWAEVDPDLWWDGFLKALASALETTGVPPAAIRGVGLSTLFPTLIPFDGRGNPLAPAILYCDQRSTEQADAMRDSGLADTLQKRTSNRVAPGTFALTSLLWLRDERPDIYARAACFGMVNTLFSMRLAGVPGLAYPSGLLFGLCNARNPSGWSPELAELAGIDPAKLPPLYAPGSAVGTVTAEAARATGLAEGTPVAAGAGDAAAAPFGGGCISPGDIFYTTGSSDCVSFVIGRPQTSLQFANAGYLTADTRLSIGTSTSTGAAVDWFAGQFLGETSGAAVAREAGDAPVGASGLTFLPYLQGERTPLWNPRARGAFSGLSLAAGRKEMARAVLEGTAFALRQIVETIEHEGGVRVKSLPTAGGGARNALWNQIKADVTGRELAVFEFQEFSALGAAMLAGTACGVFRTIEDAVARTASVRRCSAVIPNMAAHADYKEPYKRYVELYPRVAAG
jgi:xylulokinase